MTVIAATQGESDQERSGTSPDLSVVIPCLNEAQSIEACARGTFTAMKRSGLIGEVVVADNGSTDDSGDLALHAGARVIRVPDCYVLLHAPTHLFVLPGATLAFLGTFMSATLLAHIGVLGRQWDLHTLIGGSLLMVTGAQLIGLGLCAHAYASYFMGERSRWFEWARRRWRLEHGLMAGCAVGIAGSAILVDWLSKGLGDLSQERAAIAGGTLLTLGIQIAFTSCFLSILGLRHT